MYQRLVIAGNLGRDPESRYTPSGTMVTTFPVATNRRWTDAQGQAKEETIWFRVSVWGNLAEVCGQYLGKGQKVLVEGELKADPQTGGPQVYKRKDDTVGASFEVRGTMVRFLSRKEDASEEVVASVGSSEEDLPF